MLAFITADANAEYHRSQKAKAIFKFSHLCPSAGKNRGSYSTCIINQIKALACGGADEPSHMQWQTKKDAINKRQVEAKGLLISKYSTGALLHGAH